MDRLWLYGAVLMLLLAAVLFVPSCQVPDLFGPREYGRWRIDPLPANTPRIVATCTVGIGSGK